MTGTFHDHAVLVTQTAAHLKGGQRALDHDARVGHAIQAMHALSPGEILGIRKGHACSMVCSILHTQDARWIQALEDHLASIPPNFRSFSTCTPPFGTGRRAPLEAWARIFPKGHNPSAFFAWMGTHPNLSPDELAWMLEQDALWTDDPATVLDVIQSASYTMRTPLQRPVLLAHLTKAWERFDSMPDAPDPRTRTGSNLWAMGCARRGWMEPHRYGGTLFSEIRQRMTSAHAKMGMLAAMRPWTQWVGMGKLEVDDHLARLVRRANGIDVPHGLVSDSPAAG